MSSLTDREKVELAKLIREEVAKAVAMQPSRLAGPSSQALVLSVGGTELPHTRSSQGTRMPISAGGSDKAGSLSGFQTVPDYRPMVACPILEGWANPQWLPSDQKNNWGITDLGEVANGAFTPTSIAVPATVYDLAASIRKAEQEGRIVHAFGSLFGFSDASFPQSAPITPQNSQVYGISVDTSGLKASLQPLLPGILRTVLVPETLFFVEAGIKLADLCNLLDHHVPALALKTMGGSAGQSLAGAISTGTHGSDFDRPPLADCVRALYIVGAGGVHHWVEGTYPLTDPVKLTNLFPCLLPENIHYDTDMLQAAMCSFGAMGVIYAAVIEVVPEYKLVQVTRHSRWEQLLSPITQGGAGPDLGSAMSGDWTGLSGYLTFLSGYLGNQSWAKNRALQVVINPIKNDDGTHQCYVTNRAELNWPGGPFGVAPGNLGSLNPGDLFAAVSQDSDCGLAALLNLQALNNFELQRKHSPPSAPMDPLIQNVKDFVMFCEELGYKWAVRAAINYVLSQALPEFDLGRGMFPQTDLGHKVMASAVFTGDSSPQSSPLSFCSTEAFFDLKAGIAYVNQLLQSYDLSVDEASYPAGYISLRLCGQTHAMLGQQRSSPTACIETALLVAEWVPDITVSGAHDGQYGHDPHDGVAFIRKAEQLALEMGGFLHWGQSNGLMLSTNVRNYYGESTVRAWQSYQQKLGGKTFTNYFLSRLGLA